MSNDVIFLSCIDTKAGEVYADEKPTTIEPSDTDSAASTWNFKKIIVFFSENEYFDNKKSKLFSK